MMSIDRSVAVRMDEVKGIFLQAQLFSASLENIDAIVKKLEDIRVEYRLIAYEAAAMVLALSDLKENNPLNRWRSFVEKISEPIIPHAHLGLGWALARQDVSSTIIKSIEPAMRFRVVDSWGYYDGTFRHRMAVKTKKTPDHFSQDALHAYDQGVGRSLWYTTLGQVNALQETIESFPVSRHLDLWRGVGIACAFVGGCSEGTLKAIATIAGNYQIQLGVGATMAAKARLQTLSPTEDIELACRVWCNLSAHDSMLLALNTENNIEWKDDTWEDSYAELVSESSKELTLISAPVLENQSK